MENIINENLELKSNSNNIETKQNNFLGKMIGNAINTAADMAIRAALPDFLEEQVINVKNNILNHGFKDGIKQTINDAIDLGKSAIGLFKGDLKDVEQMQNVVKSGGVLDGVSDLWDFAVNTAKSKGAISNTIASTLKKGKNALINNVESNIQDAFKTQSKIEIQFEKNIDNWKKAFEEQDFKTMEKEFKKIEKGIEELVPIENALKAAREIENLHTLIKNNGQDFNLSSEDLELVKNL